MGPYFCLWSKHSKIGGVEEQPQDTRIFLKYFPGWDIVCFFFTASLQAFSAFSAFRYPTFLSTRFVMYIYIWYMQTGENRRKMGLFRSGWDHAGFSQNIIGIVVLWNQRFDHVRDPPVSMACCEKNPYSIKIFRGDGEFSSHGASQNTILKWQTLWIVERWRYPLVN